MNLPENYQALEPFLKKWNQPTMNQRWKERLNSTQQELQAFYDAMLPRLGEMLEDIDKFPLGEISDEYQPVYNLLMSHAEIAPHVELYGGKIGVPHAFEETRFVALRGDYE